MDRPISERNTGIAVPQLSINDPSLDGDAEDAPNFSSGAGVPTRTEPNGSVHLRDNGSSVAALYARISGAWQAIITATGLASVANGEGLSLLGFEDAAGHSTTTDGEAAVAELYTFVRTQICTVTLTAGAESSDVIAVTINVVDLGGTAVSRAQKLICSLYEATMIEAVAAVFTMAETGAGTEISTTANARLIIDTDSSGDAIVSVTDVATGSGKTMYLVVQPVPTSGTNTYGTPAVLALTFD